MRRHGSVLANNHSRELFGGVIDPSLKKFASDFDHLSGSPQA